MIWVLSFTAEIGVRLIHPCVLYAVQYQFWVYVLMRVPLASPSCRANACTISITILSFLATSPDRSLLPAGPQAYTLYPHWVAVCRFKLVASLLLDHVKWSIEVHHLWVRTIIYEVNCWFNLFIFQIVPCNTDHKLEHANGYMVGWLDDGWVYGNQRGLFNAKSFLYIS